MSSLSQATRRQTRPAIASGVLVEVQYGPSFQSLDDSDVMRIAPEGRALDLSYLDGLLCDWIETMMDFRDGVGEYDNAGKSGDALHFHGKAHSYEHAYRELNAIAEYVKCVPVYKMIR